jgi:predicted  nucleic acid-binding Zn-ribbon protein
LYKQIALLVKLQAVDKTLYEAEQELLAIPERLTELADREAVLAQTLSELEAQLEDVAGRRKALETENDSIRSRLRRAENRLMAAKSTKEYQAANAEIGEAKDAIKSNDDTLIEFMEKQDGLTTQVKQQKELSSEFDKQAGQERKKLAERQAHLEKAIASMQGDREGLTDGVDSSLLSQYDFIRQRRQGVALAPVSTGTCLACHMDIPPQQFNELQRMDKVMICPSCSRLIYWADADEFSDL